MRFILFFLFVTLAFSSDYLNTQALNKNIIENINPPTGYKPFFINLLSRHSARYLSSENKIKNALKILDKYNIYLTSNGIKLRKKLLKIKAFEDGKYGKISKIGKTLAIKIGDEFYKKFKNVFIDDKTILVYYTSIIRTKQSADYFLKDFKNVKIIESKNDEILRFFLEQKFPQGIDFLKQLEKENRVLEFVDLNSKIYQVQAMIYPVFPLNQNYLLCPAEKKNTVSYLIDVVHELGHIEDFDLESNKGLSKQMNYFFALFMGK